MGQDINKSVSRAFVLIGRRPVAKVRHAMFCEECKRMISKACVQIIEPAGRGMVGAQFVRASLSGR